MIWDAKLVIISHFEKLAKEEFGIIIPVFPAWPRLILISPD